MHELQTKQLTLDSREVAQMMNIKHYQILEKLEGTKTVKGIIPTLTDHKIMVSDYFIPSTYKDESGKENKCYQFTKMGCEFIANKFTGEKGILFTAKYVEKFNQMEVGMQQPQIKALAKESKAGGLNGLLKTLNGVMKEEKISASQRAEVLKDVAEQCGLKIPENFIKKPEFIQISLTVPIN